MPLLELPEYSTLTCPGLPTEVAGALARTGAVQVSLDLENRIQLISSSHVGVLQVGDYELRITPKLKISRLLWLIGYAIDPKGWRDEEQVGLLKADDLVKAIAVSFVAACNRALSHGLLRGYRVAEEATVTLRGRLREADQVRRRRLVALPLEVRYDDYTVDVPENQLLLSAALRLRHLTGLPRNTRGALRRIVAVMGEVTPMVSGQKAPSPPFDQRNRHYRTASQLARLILSGRSLEQPAGATTATGFLFDLHVVFEQWLTTALREAPAPYGGYLQSQCPGYLDVEKSIRMRPDLVWERSGKPVGDLDAKYKSLGLEANGPNSDLYQMLAYCTVLDLHSGHVVYAAGEQQPGHCLVVNTSTTIPTSVIHLGESIPVLLQEVKQLATSLNQMTPMDAMLRASRVLPG